MLLGLVVAPPAVAALVVLVLLFVVFEFYFRTVIEPWIEALEQKRGRGPVDRLTRRLGRFLRDTWDWLEGQIVERWKRYIDLHVAPIVQWFTGLATVLRRLPEEVAAFAEEVEQQLRFLVQERLFDPDRGVIPKLRGELRALRAELLDAATGRVIALERGLASLADRLFDEKRGWIWRLGAAIDALRARLFNPQTGAIPRLDVRLDRLTARLFDQAEGWVWRLGHAIDSLRERLFDPETGVIPQLRARLGRVERQGAATAAWVLPVAAVVPAAVAATALQAAAESEPKLRRLCRLDPDATDELFELTPIPPWPLLLAAITGTALAAAELSRLLEPHLPGEARGA